MLNYFNFLSKSALKYRVLTIQRMKGNFSGHLLMSLTISSISCICENDDEDDGGDAE
jgi:hypothetical protein